MFPLGLAFIAASILCWIFYGLWEFFRPPKPAPPERPKKHRRKKGLAEVSVKGEIWRLDFSSYFTDGIPLYIWYSPNKGYYLKEFETDGGILISGLASAKKFDDTQVAIHQMKMFAKPEWVQEYYRIGDAPPDDFNVGSLGCLLFGIGFLLIMIRLFIAFIAHDIFGHKDYIF